MIKAAIERILELGRVEMLETAGREFTNLPVHEVKPFFVEPLQVHTLQAVVDFFAGELGETADIAKERVVIQVVDPAQVVVLEGVADDTYRQREHYLTAKRLHGEFAFGKWFEQQEMVINLMTMFEQTAALDDVLKVVSGLVVANEATVSDDGVSQDVQVKSGVGRVANVTIENPILLAPIRTFTEIEQVEAPYVLRVRKNRDGAPEVAIFEAGGGAWKNEAVLRIKEWLADRLPGTKILG